MASVIKPFFPFYGSKYRLAKHYPEPGRMVIEPFAGSACYSLWHQVEEVVLIDANPNIAAVWDYLLTASEEDIQNLPDVYDHNDSVDNYDIPDGAKDLIGYWLNKGSAPVKKRGAYASRDEWRSQFWRPQIKDRIASQLHAIEGWSIIKGDYSQAPMVDDATYFIDPPYATSGRHYKTKFYRYNELAAWSKNLPGSVIVCEEWGADWLPFTLLGEFKTFATGSNAECVWLNE